MHGAMGLFTSCLDHGPWTWAGQGASFYQFLVKPPIWDVLEMRSSPFIRHLAWSLHYVSFSKDTSQALCMIPAITVVWRAV